MFFVLEINNGIIVQWLINKGLKNNEGVTLYLPLSMKKLFCFVSGCKEDSKAAGSRYVFGSYLYDETFNGTNISVYNDGYENTGGYNLLIGI